MKTFRLIALDETDYYDTIPKGVEKIYGIYLFCDGEAIYCASLTPSTWLEPIDVSIVYYSGHRMECDDDAYLDLYDSQMECGRYVPYLTPENFPDLTSQGIEINSDREDFDSDEEWRDDAWNQAKEEVRCSPPRVGGVYP